jgi:cytochrome P450
MTQPHEGTSAARTAGRALTTLPGPRGLPLVGNLFQLKVTQLHTILEHWADTYGPLYTFRLGRQPVVVMAAPALIQAVLRQRPETYRRLGAIARVLEDMGGNGLFAAEGAAWRRQRRVVVPALTMPQLRQFFPTLTTVTAHLKTWWDRAARAGAVVDMPPDLLRYTVEVMTRVIFGDDLSLAHELAGLQQHLAQILALINRRIMAPWPSWGILTRPANHAVERAIAALQTALATALAQRRARRTQVPTAATPPTTLVEALLAARDEAGTALSDDEILGNIFTLLVAGTETTANTLAWMMHFLTDLPAVQRAMQQEADAVLGEARLLPEFQAHERLRYSEAVAHETLRLKSVAPVLCVEPTRAVAVDGIQLPAGTAVFLLTRYSGLHEPAFTGAGQFQPERWLTAPMEPHTGHAPQALMPFGGGPRVCPGRHLAFLEMKAVMAMLCRNFTLTKPVGTPPVGEHFAFTMKPTHLILQVRHRESERQTGEIR